MKTSVAALAEELSSRAAKLPENKQYWIGIAGAPGSGKSTLCKALKERQPDCIAVIQMDGYHMYRHELDAMNNSAVAHARRGAPFTFHAERFVKETMEARKSGSGSFPDFDHGTGDPVEDAVKLVRGQTAIVLVEGNYLLLDERPWCRLRKDVFDESWFLDVSIDVCRQRVYERHLSTGKSKSEAEKRVNCNDGPNAEMVSSISRKNADRIIGFD